MEGQDEAHARAVLVAMQERLIQGPHSALQVQQHATAGEIRTAFLQLTKVFHPARFGRMSTDLQRMSNEIFLALRAAHDTLSKPARRQTAPTGPAPTTHLSPPQRPSTRIPLQPAPAAPRPITAQPASGRVAAVPFAMATTGSAPNPQRSSAPPTNAPRSSVQTNTPTNAPRSSVQTNTPINASRSSAPVIPPTHASRSSAPAIPPTHASRSSAPMIPPNGQSPGARSGATNTANTTQRLDPAAVTVQPSSVPPTQRPAGALGSGGFRTTPVHGIPVTPPAPAAAPAPTAPAPAPARPTEPELVPIYDAMQRGQWDAARRALATLLVTAPTSNRYLALVSYTRGRQAQLDRKLDEARVELHEALQHDPDLQLAKTALGELFARRK